MFRHCFKDRLECLFKSINLSIHLFLNFSQARVLRDSLVVDVRQDKGGNVGNRGAMAVVGVCAAKRARLSVSTGKYSDDRYRDNLEQNLRQHSQITRWCAGHLELLPQEVKVGKQSAASGVSLVGLAWCRERRDQLQQIDLGVSHQAGQMRPAMGR